MESREERKKRLKDKLSESIDYSHENSDEEIQDLIDELLIRESREIPLTLSDRKRLKKELFHAVRKLDVLQELVDEPRITEIMINGPKNIFIEQDGRLYQSELQFDNEEKLHNVIQQIVAECNRVVNDASPIVDARLHNGARVNVVLNPVAINGPIVTIRRFPEKPITMEDLVSFGSVTEEVCGWLHKLVRAKYNIFISGGTGSGKSSLVNLIPRFYDAEKGSVKVDGVDVKEYDLTALRDKIGVVMQKAVLFHGTIRENLKWGNESASDEELWEALRTAQAKEFVLQKKDQLDEMIEQEGRNLSGGQRQRLSIARALVKKPEILILDDSASALDYATDAALRRSLKEMPGETTVFIVSQRASSLMHADTIIVLDDGNVAGMGTHEELLKTCEVYQEIYYSQFERSDKGDKKEGEN